MISAFNLSRKILSLCAVWDLSLVENEFRLMFYIHLYNDLRKVLFEMIQCIDLFWLPEGDMLFSNEWFSVATFVGKDGL